MPERTSNRPGGRSPNVSLFHVARARRTCSGQSQHFFNLIANCRRFSAVSFQFSNSGTVSVVFSFGFSLTFPCTFPTQFRIRLCFSLCDSHMTSANESHIASCHVFLVFLFSFFLLYFRFVEVLSLSRNATQIRCKFSIHLVLLSAEVEDTVGPKVICSSSNPL